MQRGAVVSSGLLPLILRPESSAAPISLCLRGSTVAVMWSDGSLQQLALTSPADLPACQLELQAVQPFSTHTAGKLAGIQAEMASSRKRKASRSTASEPGLPKRRKGADSCLPGLAQVSRDLLAVAGWLEQSSSHSSSGEVGGQPTRQLAVQVQDLQFGSSWASTSFSRPASAAAPVQVRAQASAVCCHLCVCVCVCVCVCGPAG